jgi:hypothetical protein
VDLDRKQALFVLTAGRFGPLFLSAPVRHKFIPADRLPPESGRIFLLSICWIFIQNTANPGLELRPAHQDEPWW